MADGVSFHTFGNGWMWKQYKKKVRLKIYERDNFTCQYCGWNMKIFFELYLMGEIPHTSVPLTLDHLVPRPRRRLPARLEMVPRDWSENNLVTSCSKCNNLKDNRLVLPSEFEFKYGPWELSTS